MPETASGSYSSLQIEAKMMEILRLRHHAWIIAGEDHREIARQRFISALNTFLAIVFDAARDET